MSAASRLTFGVLTYSDPPEALTSWLQALKMRQYASEMRRVRSENWELLPSLGHVFNTTSLKAANIIASPDALRLRMVDRFLGEAHTTPEGVCWYHSAVVESTELIVTPEMVRQVFLAEVIGTGSEHYTTDDIRSFSSGALQWVDAHQASPISNPKPE